MDCTALSSTEIITVIIAARNEVDYLPICLDTLLAQDSTAGPVQVVVSANNCMDATVAVAQSRQAAFVGRGWQLDVIDRQEAGKPGALNAGDAVAKGDQRIYLDADVKCDPGLLGELRAALASDAPVYATGHLRVALARTLISRLYGRFWMQVPFMKEVAPGPGLYAVNAAGRARWEQFPEIISDDGFVRLNFAPHERVEVDSGYEWPVVEGFSALIRVRRRQDRGMNQLFEHYPELGKNSTHRRAGPITLTRLMLRDPFGFVVYALVALLVRRQPAGQEWSRGR